MTLLFLSSLGFQSQLQADWKENVYDYYCLVRWIAAEKWRSWFGKAAAIEPEELYKQPEYKFKKYRIRYNQHGKRVVILRTASKSCKQLFRKLMKR